MGWFDSEAVKQLKKDAAFIGGLVADQAFGRLPPGAADEMIGSTTQRAKLKQALDAAAKELGPDKARKKAISAAGDDARMRAQVQSLPWRDVERLAEDAIRQMLTASEAQ